jgi:hypothetical protein
MSKSTKWSTWTISSYWNIITFSWFINLKKRKRRIEINLFILIQTNFRMKLLFSTCMTIFTTIINFTYSWINPFITLFNMRTWCWSINIKFSNNKTSNARLKTRSALSRRNDVSKLPPNYLFIQFYSSVNPYKKIVFCEKRSPLCKKMNPKKFKK